MAVKKKEIKLIACFLMALKYKSLALDSMFERIGKIDKFTSYSAG